MPKNSEGHYYIFRKSATHSGMLDFWNHCNHAWQCNKPDDECQFLTAELAYNEKVTHNFSDDQVYVGNQWFRRVDRNGEVIEAPESELVPAAS